MKYQYTSCTHEGLVRELNEDNFCVLNEYNTFIVCDGMGGHAAGEIASMMAVNSAKAVFELDYHYDFNNDLDYQENDLILSTLLANEFIFREGLINPGKKGMGTTFIGFNLNERGLLWTSVGDSRLYRFSDNNLSQISVDHSLLNELILAGEISKDDTSSFKKKNIITRTIGTAEDTSIDYGRIQVSTNDKYLICSDGLSDYVPEMDIQISFKENPNLDSLQKDLLDKALKAGAPDNVTFVIVEILEAVRDQVLYPLKTLNTSKYLKVKEIQSIISELHISDDGYSIRKKLDKITYKTKINYLENKRYFYLGLALLAVIIGLSISNLMKNDTALDSAGLDSMILTDSNINAPEIQTPKFELFIFSFTGRVKASNLNVFVNDSLYGQAERFEENPILLEHSDQVYKIELYAGNKLFLSRKITRKDYATENTIIVDLDAIDD